ncbi:restriction endonuclease subunit S [Macrococcoides bohemicum]|uniref:restriction endonuclease subunit S n=1 Tax=Macrococcoides bohemicum TaxID=1903056 RepID=UPI0023EA6FE9|nr:restriction endonuclease subunit S [Macrococcus bohemicus]
MFLKNVNKHYNLGKDTYTWEQRKLEEVYNFQYGEFNNNPDNGGIYPIYGANGVIGGYDKYNSEDAMVIGHMGAYAGHVIWVNGKHFVTYNGTIAKEIKDVIFGLFGYYMVTGLNIYRKTAGSGQPFVSYQDLNRIKCFLPTLLEEQHKIGEFLKQIDDTITLLQRKINNLNKVKKGLLQKLFPTEQSINPRIRFNGFNQDWEQRKLRDLLNKNSEKNKNLSVINVESVSNKTGFTKQTDQFEDYSVASADLSNYYVIREKQFAYNPSRINVGSIAYKDLGDEISVVSPLYVSFSTKKILNDGFLWNWFKTASFDAQRQRLSEGGVRDTLSFNQLSEMNTMFPTYPEQQKIGSFFKQLDNTIALLQKELEMNKQIKKGFLQKLFPKE